MPLGALLISADAGADAGDLDISMLGIQSLGSTETSGSSVLGLREIDGGMVVVLSKQLSPATVLVVSVCVDTFCIIIKRGAIDRRKRERSKKEIWVGPSRHHR